MGFDLYFTEEWCTGPAEACGSTEHCIQKTVLVYYVIVLTDLIFLVLHQYAHGCICMYAGYVRRGFYTNESNISSEIRSWIEVPGGGGGAAIGAGARWPVKLDTELWSL